jgi:hypothetical protein
MCLFGNTINSKTSQKIIIGGKKMSIKSSFKKAVSVLTVVFLAAVMTGETPQPLYCVMVAWL